MPVLDHNLERYLHETLGAVIQPTPWEGASRLPPFLSDRYRFLQATLFDDPVLFMVDESPAEESPAKIRKHIAQVQPKSDWPVVYARERVTAYNRKRLIQHRVPFVVPGNQMYLPDLGIDLREHFRKQVASHPLFRPGTQAIFVYALLHERPGPFVASEFAPELGYSAMTLSRAFDEIEAAELAESRVTGRERYLHFTAPRRELWKRAQGFLKDPVKSRHFIQPAPNDVLGPKAGLTALARYSMMADPPNPVVAMSREHWTSLRQRGTVTVLPMQEPQAYEVEVWSYAPRPYRDLDAVDPLSLYLSLKKSSDERIEQALGHMLETLPW